MSCTSSSSARDGSKHSPYIMRQGKLFELEVKFVRNGRSVNLNSPVRTGRSQMRPTGEENTTSGLPTSTLTVTVTDAARGLVLVSLGATTTADVPIGVYVCDVEMEDTGSPDPDDVIGGDPFYIEVIGSPTR